MIFVRKITTLLVIGEISKLKKNQYGHIDRGLFLNCNQSECGLELEEVFDDLAAFGMIFVE